MIISSMEKETKITNLGTGFFVQHRIVREQSLLVSYMVLTVSWYIIVLNVHAPSEEKSDDSKDTFMRNYSRFFLSFS